MMAKSIYNEKAREEILKRLERLTPETPRLWGKMEAPQMIRHLRDQLLLAMGELKDEKQGPWYFRAPAGKWLLINIVPWPKGKTPSPRGLVHRIKAPVTSEFEEDKARLLDALKIFLGLGKDSLHPHPFFGRLSKSTWGRLTWKHMDHHLKQFGL